MRPHADEQATASPENHVDVSAAVLGSYAVGAEQRDVSAVTTQSEGLCVIDQGPGGALLVEPRLEGMSEARAVGADYLTLASERGEPQTRHPWPADGSVERGES